MSVPFTKYHAVNATAAGENLFRLEAPTAGVLARLVVKQTSGTTDGFTVNVYDRDISHPDSWDTEVHKVIDSAIAGSGEATIGRWERVYPYENRDDRTDLALRPTSAIYIGINVASAGGTGKTFHVGYTVLQTEMI